MQKEINKRQNNWPLLVTELVLIVTLVGAAFVIYNLQQKNDSLKQDVQTRDTQISEYQAAVIKTKFSSTKGVELTVYAPTSGQKVSSPLVVLGQVPGSWSFEASFPVKILDSKGVTIAQGPAHLIGDWTTDSLVPFSVELTWTAAVSGSGTLVLSKDNPSGLSTNDDSLSIPVNFATK